MRLSHLLLVITTTTAQSPFANTFDVSRAIRQFTTSFLNDLGETAKNINEDNYQLVFLFRTVHLHKLCVLPVLHPLSVHAAPVWRRGADEAPAAEDAGPHRLRGDQGPVLRPLLQPQVRLRAAVHSQRAGISPGLQTQAGLHQVPG